MTSLDTIYCKGKFICEMYFISDKPGTVTEVTIEQLMKAKDSTKPGNYVSRLVK